MFGFPPPPTSPEPPLSGWEPPIPCDSFEHRIFRIHRLLRRAAMFGVLHEHGHGRSRRRQVFQGQGRVLAVLSMQSPIAQNELAYVIGVRPQSLGEVLSKLEDAGLVRREVDPNDARARLVHITDAGLEKAKELAEQPHIDATSGLTDEQRDQLCALLDLVIDHLEETHKNEQEPPEGPPHRMRGRGRHGHWHEH